VFGCDRNGAIPDRVLKTVIVRYNTIHHLKSKAVLRYDRSHLIKEFDRDNDGEISITDLMVLPSENQAHT
jgi:Ca2+-binding EF-hand superfamily protein